MAPVLIPGITFTEPPALKARFLVSYAGEVEYEVGRRVYRVRYFGNPAGPWNGDYFFTGIMPFIGTVANQAYSTGGAYSGNSYFEFPPRDVVALFPGFVGARYTDGFKAVEYDGPAPRLLVGHFWKGVCYQMTFAGCPKR